MPFSQSSLLNSVNTPHFHVSTSARPNSWASPAATSRMYWRYAGRLAGGRLLNPNASRYGGWAERAMGTLPVTMCGFRPAERRLATGRARPDTFTPLAGPAALSLNRSRVEVQPG